MEKSSLAASDGAISSWKWCSLALILVHTAVTPLLFRWVTTSATEPERYNRYFALFIAEVLKLISSFFFIIAEQNYSVSSTVNTVHSKIIMQPMDTLQLAVPAILYFIQNVLLQKASSNLPAAMFQVTYQGKTLVVAFFSVFLLQKQLTRAKWLAIFLMAAGIAIVEASDEKKVAQSFESHVSIGLFFILCACFCSGFAAVYFEKMLKTGGKKSLWVTNFQFALCSLLISGFQLLAEGERIDNLFHGFNSNVWLRVVNNAVGGLCVAFVIRHADNILKGFACALAAILSEIAAVPFFGLQLSFMFFMGMMVVVYSTLLYGGTMNLSDEFWNSEPVFSKGVKNNSMSSDYQPDYIRVPLKDLEMSLLPERGGSTKI